jgi:hypothetical protein
MINRISINSIHSKGSIKKSNNQNKGRVKKNRPHNYIAIIYAFFIKFKRKLFLIFIGIRKSEIVGHIRYYAV